MKIYRRGDGKGAARQNWEILNGTRRHGRLRFNARLQLSLWLGSVCNQNTACMLPPSIPANPGPGRQTWVMAQWHCCSSTMQIKHEQRNKIKHE